MEMTNCPKCLKPEGVIIVDTKIDYRRYRCLECDEEWADKPNKEETKEWN